jgi:hypothetical protein
VAKEAMNRAIYGKTLRKDNAAGSDDRDIYTSFGG